MELSNDWHRRTNKRLFDILADILKESQPQKTALPSKPSHGYTIAEKAPEIVTAPGAYFPATKGQVIPLAPRQGGGEVDPSLFKNAMTFEGMNPMDDAQARRIKSLSQEAVAPIIPTPAVAPPITSQPIVTPPVAPRPEAAPVQPPLSWYQQRTQTSAPIGKPLSSFAPQQFIINPPKPFKYNSAKPGLSGVQEAEYNKRNKPYQDMINRIGNTPLIPRQGGGVVGPDLTEQEKQETLNRLREASNEKNIANIPTTGNRPTPINLAGMAPDTTTGTLETVPKPDLSAMNTPAEVETLRSHGQVKPSTNLIDMAPNETGTFEAAKNIAGGEPKKKRSIREAAGIPDTLESQWGIKKEDIGPDKERYTLPEGQGIAEVTYPMGASGTKVGQDFGKEEVLSRWKKESDALQKGIEARVAYENRPRSYYEAHPEEKLIDEARQENKPLMDAYMKMIEQTQNIIKGNFGDVMMSKRAKREARNAAIANLPHLQQGLAQLGVAGLKEPTPHLVQTATGEHVWVFPPGTIGGKVNVFPTGVVGKTPVQDTSEWRTHEAMGKEKGWTREQTLADWDRKQIERAGKKAEVTMNMQTGGTTSFPNWDEATKRQSFDNFIINNQKPTFAWRDAKSRNAWEQEFNKYLIEKGKTAESVGETRFYRGAQKKALDNNEVYRVAAERFVNVIDQNVDLVKKLKKQYGVNYGKLINTAVNNITQGIPGSGDLASLQQALISLSNEVAKVESGSMGVAEVSVEQAKIWKKIHDYNFNVEDLDKVLDTSKQLGQIRRKSLQETTDALRKELGEKEVKPGETPTTKTVVKQFVSPSTGKTKYIYSDGTEEIR